MLADPQSAEMLKRVLADPESYTVKEETLIEEFEAKLRRCALIPEQYARFEAALSDSARFYLAIACLKVSLAQQSKALGSN
jgi:hypothetical protein